ncbi:TPA: hypothetical protein ACF7ZB_001859 [Kluyvera georgiana]
MIVPFAKVYNALCIWIPADDSDGHSVVISEPPVNFSHSARPFSFISAKAPTNAAHAW